MRHLHNIIVLTTIVVTIIITSIFGCSKKGDQPVKADTTYDITYAFTSKASSYYVQIWDGTNLNDFADSAHTSPYTKTIRYNYTGTHRCRIDNANNKASDKSISITLNGVTKTASDSLYSSLESAIVN